MKFVAIFTSDPAQLDREHSEQEIATMGRLIGEMRAAGVLVDTGGTNPTGVSMRVRRDGPDITATDGPFAESKEVIGGFAVLNVRSKDEALQWTRRFLEIGGDSAVDLVEVSPTPF